MSKDCILTNAVMSGDLAQVQDVLANTSGEIDLNAALVAAAEIGRLDIIICLRKSGANIRMWDSLALRKAAANGHLLVVKYFYKRNVDLSVKDNFCLRWAAHNGHFDVVQYLVEHLPRVDVRKSGGQAAEWAAEKGHADVLQYLCENIGIKYYGKLTIWLRQACWRGWLGVVKYLHSIGADVRTEHDLPLKLAAEAGHAELVEYLHKQCGCDVSLVQKWHPDLEWYPWLHTQVSPLMRLAAKCYVQHQDKPLPAADSVPELVRDVLIASKKLTLKT